MSKFFTGLGDKGYTNLIKRGRVRKDSKIICAIGDIDELNSAIGVAISNLTADRIARTLKVVQNALFIIGAELASSSSSNIVKNRISAFDVKFLEDSIYEIGSSLSIDKFVLPGGSISASYIHLARAICRRAERSIITLGSLKNPYIISYINRLSSYLFVAALYANRLEGVEESSPTY
ncbi:MAG: cob(I)yrinic acid a,c-diamide adenosyltransferase [Candidatus Micrarchaeia archaeon]